MVEAKLTKNEELDAYCIVKVVQESQQLPPGSLPTSPATSLPTSPSHTTLSRSTLARSPVPAPTLGRKASLAITGPSMNRPGLESVLVGKTKTAWNSKTPWFDEEFEVELSDGFTEVASKSH